MIDIIMTIFLYVCYCNIAKTHCSEIFVSAVVLININYNMNSIGCNLIKVVFEKNI